MMEEGRFVTKEERIAIHEKITRDHILEYFEEHFFKNPKRLNVLFHAEDHKKTDDFEKNAMINKEFYAREDLFGKNRLKV